VAGKCACSKTCNCCTDTSPSIGVSGTGSLGQCFTPEVRYSADAGNRARPGTDGAVLADLCATNPDGTPTTVDGNGCLVLPPPCILDQGGDPIEPNEAGCVQLPANTPPAYGCGLDQDGEGTLILDTPTAWPANDLWGTPFGGGIGGTTAVFCMEEGGVRGVPEHTSFVVSAGGEIVDFLPDFEPIPDGTAYASAASAPLAVVNPSPNRRLTVFATLVGLVDASSPPSGDVYGRLQVRRDGGSWTTVRELRWPDNRLDGAPVIRDEKELIAHWDGQLDPGDGLTLEVRVVVANTSDAGGDPATVQRIRWAMKAMGVTV